MCSMILRFVVLFFVVAVALLGYTFVTSGFEAFVKLLGILALVFIGGLVVLAIVLRFAMRFIGKKILVALEGMAGSTTPRRIKLEPRDNNDKWIHAGDIKQSADDFTDLGFSEVGAFSVDELPAVSLRAFCHPTENVYGVLYESPSIGVWSDLVCYVQDGTKWKHYTYTNNQSPHAGLLDKPAHAVSVKAAGDVRALFHKFQAEVPSAGRRKLTVADFTKAFEKAWADEIDWRNARGGPTEDEVRRVAAIDGKEVTEEKLQETRDVLTHNALEQLDETLRENYFTANNISQSEQEAMRLVVIHDKLRAADLKQKLAGEVEDVVDVNLPNQPPRQAFSTVNDSLPEGRRFKLVGKVDAPIAADVYTPPNA